MLKGDLPRPEVLDAGDSQLSAPPEAHLKCAREQRLGLRGRVRAEELLPILVEGVA